jgi:hypothetical protein
MIAVFVAFLDEKEFHQIQLYYCSAQIGKQIDSDLMSLSNEKTLETADK